MKSLLLFRDFFLTRCRALSALGLTISTYGFDRALLSFASLQRIFSFTLARPFRARVHHFHLRWSL
jgi:hypothetical protein